MSMTLEQAKEKLAKYGQEHVLKYYGELTEEEKRGILDQIEATDMSILEACKHKEDLAKKGVITPLAAMQLDEIEANRENFTATGIEAIRQGKVAAVLLAGGMGTRLGSDNPKGMYNVGLTHELYIFECLVNNLLEVVHQADAWIHLFVMTSDKNNDATIAFLQEHDYFGYKAEYVHFFKQEMAAATDYDGKIYLEEKGKLSTSPNGNGGWFSSLERAGLMDTIVKNNIKWINVFSVDNVLQGIADPVFLGAVLKEGYVSGGKVIKKADPHERVGVLCMKDGKPFIVEYYELSEEMAYEKNERGEYAYNYGVTLNYMFPVDKLMNLLDKKMPLHVVKKKVPYINNEGEFVKPEEPNGYKFETLALDMIGYMETCLPFEVVREKEFAPIKNATGVDSIETAKALLVKNGYTL